jgi:multidrug efflux pump subunit AcrA (membrane-fusion protein)
MSPDSFPDRTGAAAAATGSLQVSTRQRRLWKVLLPAALLLAAAAGGFAIFRSVFQGGTGGDEKGALLYTVSRGPLQVTVTAEGNVESASNIEVKCRVAGGSTILWIVEDGKIVEEGEEIVKLDTSAIDDKLNSQRITYEKALATEIQAREDVAAATISVKEYEEGTSIELLKQVEAEIQIAMENLRSAENQLKYSLRMVRKGFASSLQREADEFAVERAKLDLDAANTKKKVLVEFTKPKTLKDLEAKREAATARLRSEQAGLQLEKARLDRLQEQLKNCVIVAPTKGMVVYANDSGGGGRFGGRESQSQVEAGAVVRESQPLVRLPDLSRMQAKVAIHESRVDQIHAGLPARLVIQDQEYDGKVLSVANQPQAGSWYSAKVKEYATVVSIEGGTSGLKPGMTAKVTILVASLQDAITLPVSSVVEQRGQFACWVKGATGPERRVLKLGHTNDKVIEVADGVKEGEVVYRNPRAMVEEAREEPAFEQQLEDERFKGGESLAATAPPGRGSGARELAAPPAGAEGRAAEPVPAVGPADAAANGPQGGGEPRRDGAPGEPGKRGGRGSFDLMQNDRDGDKKLSREELPDRMQEMFERMDGNADGFIDAAEIQEMRSRMGSRGGRSGRPGGPGAGEGGPGASDGGPGGSGGGAPRAAEEPH